MQSTIASSGVSRTQPVTASRQTTSGNRARSSRTVAKAHKVYCRSDACPRLIVERSHLRLHVHMHHSCASHGLLDGTHQIIVLGFVQEENASGMDAAKRAAVAALVAAQIALPSAGAKSSDSCLCSTESFCRNTPDCYYHCHNQAWI